MMQPSTTWDESAFAQMSWHDNHVHGLQIREGAYGYGELALDIDYILEWLCPTGTTCSFRLAPATLTFLEVSDLRIEIDYAAATAGITPFSIAAIDREAAGDAGRFKWTIGLNWPTGAISFHARGFTQVLRGSPVVKDQQVLGHAERALAPGIVGDGKP